MMANEPNPPAGDLVAACGQLKRALTQVQCAVFDLHEAFLLRDRQQHAALEQQTKLYLQRISRLARNPNRA